MSQVYLVGGAVRDELLLPVTERDWVVTGAVPEDLTSRGYRQVGANFPVFLHPDTSEEYALARTERKDGHGYHGFDVDFNPAVSIEDETQRADLLANVVSGWANRDINAAKDAVASASISESQKTNILQMLGQ